jgi:hypothetical protein
VILDGREFCATFLRLSHVNIVFSVVSNPLTFELRGIREVPLSEDVAGCMTINISTVHSFLSELMRDFYSDMYMEPDYNDNCLAISSTKLKSDSEISDCRNCERHLNLGAKTQSEQSVPGMEELNEIICSQFVFRLGNLSSSEAGMPKDQWARKKLLISR